MPKAKASNKKPAVKQSCPKCLTCSSCWSYLLMGMGLGILVTHPLMDPHPVRYGVGVLLVGVFFYFNPKILGK